MEGFDLDKDLMPILKGKIELPNYEEVDLEDGVSWIAAGGGLVSVGNVMTAKVPKSASNWGHWARYFMQKNQCGGYDGTGVVMFWDNGKGRIGIFAICKHEKTDGAGANHQKGWHPGYCKKCGLDMTVDSGD